MNVGHLFFIQEQKVINRKENVLQHIEVNILQTRKRTMQPILLSTSRRKNALCLYDSWKGTSTGPIKPQLFIMGDLQEWLYLGQEASFPIQENLQIQSSSCALSLSQRLPAAPPSSHADGKLAGGEPCCAYICPGMLHFQRHKDTATESLHCKWDICSQWTLGY